MFRLVVFAICILLASCAQQHPAPPDLPANHLALGPVSSGAASLATQPRPKNLHNDSGEHHNATGSARGSQKIIPLAYHRTTRGGVTLSLVTFDDREHQLRVADQPKGPGTRWNDARSAAKTYSGLAAINGGFFTPEGKPLGLLTETGTRRGYLNNSSLGAGLFVSAKSGSAIIRGQRYGSSSLAAKAYNLLQAGPMLVEGGKPISGLSKASRRPRSFITWDGKN
ncbi:MAG: phosphodiester glycosidase family protein, partial [Verrucomicrobiae bacterium]|nr:phosphodiester glycosidase family protein [Verrucomicrobiae bacterium]NNJ86906.1 hypothetical protein [Akkermansiaceae bacterium]